MAGDAGSLGPGGRPCSPRGSPAEQGCWCAEAGVCVLPCQVETRAALDLPSERGVWEGAREDPDGCGPLGTVSRRKTRTSAL